MNAEHPLEKVIAAYGEAWNNHDVEAILAMHTEDSVFENHTSGGKAVGKDAIRNILVGSSRHFPIFASMRVARTCETVW